MTPPELLSTGRPRLRLGLGALVVLVLLGAAVAVLVSALGSRGAGQTVTAPTPVTSVPSSSSGGGETIYVHVLGAVARPGLYVLDDGDRAVDAVAAAGGFTGTADQAQLNLARPLVDGEQIVVPNVGEAPPVAIGQGPAAGGKVNINTADEAALETLPRVGPAMAKRILDWRAANGRFTAVEDLMSVTGIGDKTFDQLKDLVTV